jgi:hypothetical protein
MPTMHGAVNLESKFPSQKGKEVPIAHKQVDHAEKTLGAMTLPDGNSGASIQLMQEKA